MFGFRKKQNQPNKGKVVTDPYCLKKRRSLPDGTDRTIETSYNSVLKSLGRISPHFEQGKFYSISGDTTVTPSENDAHIFLSIRTRRPLNGDWPAHGHEEPLANLINDYDFKPHR